MFILHAQWAHKVHLQMFQCYPLQSSATGAVQHHTTSCHTGDSFALMLYLCALDTSVTSHGFAEKSLSFWDLCLAAGFTFHCVVRWCFWSARCARNYRCVQAALLVWRAPSPRRPASCRAQKSASLYDGAIRGKYQKPCDSAGEHREELSRCVKPSAALRSVHKTSSQAIYIIYPL